MSGGPRGTARRPEPAARGPYEPRGPSNLAALEAESIHLLREVVAVKRNPVLLFSGGKDSAVMLELAARAFAPAAIPFPVLHVDTGHNFDEVIEFRDRTVRRLGVRLLVGSVADDIAAGTVAEDPGPRPSRNRAQTGTLLRMIREHRFDALFGGARRDEEKARAKERMVSLRDEFGQWEPRRQRPELWRLYNVRHRPSEHVRVFPLSNWTELDVWQYIAEQGVDLPPLYFAHRRNVFQRDGMLFAHSRHLPLEEGEELFEARVRFRTVGDATGTGCVESGAFTPDEVIAEIASSRVTERGETRADDRFSDAGMEDRKREGYF